MAKIIFLGTAGDSSVTARQLRASGGFVVQSGEFQMHVDPGPGALVRAREFGVNPRATSAILVSHNHINHCHDINAIVDAMTLGGFDKRGVLLANASTINGNERFTQALSAFHRSCLERIIVMKPGQRTGIEDIEIHAFEVAHSEPEALGFRILTPHCNIGYTGDTAHTADLAHSLEGSQILILNITFPGDVKTDSHLNRESAIKLIGKVRPRLAVITHFGFSMLKADPLLEARHIQLNTGVQTLAAQDGLNVLPSAYAVHSEQARLSSFAHEDSPQSKNI